MKKVFVFVSMVILVSACASAPTNDAAVPTNKTVATEPAPPAMTEADATAKEKAIWEAIKAKDYDAFSGMLAGDHLEVLDDGVHDKAASVEGVKQFEPSELTFSDWKFVPIDKEAFIVAYTVAQKGKFQGKEFPLTSSRGSSAWVYRDKKWVAIYHQEGPVRTAPAMPASTAKPAASPAEAPAPPTPGPDAVANEKAVWELFKSKNYDAFATMLAPDFLHVETTGFYDRAGSLEGVKMVDASKAELSDWQTVKLDNEATLVTYTLKDPKFAPKGERLSTIWVKRDGKWIILFHHGGTPVIQPSPPPPASAAPTAGASPAAKAPATP